MRGLLQGSFEIIHADHIRTFKFCKQYCEELIVALNTDQTIIDYKGREPIMKWNEKKRVLEGIRYIDGVIEGHDVPPKGILMIEDIDVYFVGDEFVEKHKDTIDWFKKNGKKVVVCPRWGNISTTEIKEKLLAEHLKGLPKNS